MFFYMQNNQEKILEFEILTLNILLTYGCFPKKSVDNPKKLLIRIAKYFKKYIFKMFIFEGQNMLH